MDKVFITKKITIKFEVMCKGKEKKRPSVYLHVLNETKLLLINIKI